MAIGDDRLLVSPDLRVALGARPMWGAGGSGALVTGGVVVSGVASVVWGKSAALAVTCSPRLWSRRRFEWAHRERGSGVL
ncbi:MAG: hypothetical protein AB1486_08645 [Planctomycetota bacterium]